VEVLLLWHIFNHEFCAKNKIVMCTPMNDHKSQRVYLMELPSHPFLARYHPIHGDRIVTRAGAGAGAMAFQNMLDFTVRINKNTDHLL
jgi:hypothetical protein